MKDRNESVNYCETCQQKITSSDLAQAKRCLRKSHKLTYRMDLENQSTQKT